MKHKQTPLKPNNQVLPLNPFRRQYNPKPLEAARILPSRVQTAEKNREHTEVLPGKGETHNPV